MADRPAFAIDVELETGLITGHAGVPGRIEAFPQTGTAAVIDRERRKRRKRGLSASEMVEGRTRRLPTSPSNTPPSSAFEDRLRCLTAEANASRTYPGV